MLKVDIKLYCSIFLALQDYMDNFEKRESLFAHELKMMLAYAYDSTIICKQLLRKFRVTICW
jgi:hypothetical protein